MAADRLSIYNGALVSFLGQRPLEALDEDLPNRHDLDQVWNTGGIKACLENGLWNFATRSSELNYEPGMTQDFGYTYAFEKPSDYCTLVMISSEGRFNEAYRHYRDEAGHWWADLPIIYVSYVSDDEDYGLDFSLWPANFTRYVEGYFAWRIAKRVAGADFEEVEGRMMRARSTARGTDAREEASVQLPRGSWSRARTAGNSSRSERGG